MIPETNGRIKIALRDLLAWLLLLSAIMGQWYDTRGQLALIRQEMSLRVSQAEQENTRIWKAIDEAKASPAPRKSGMR